MLEITEESIKQHSLTLGQFDSRNVDILVTLFHHQNACTQLTSLSNDLKTKFETLLTTKKDGDEKYNDTPLTRVELAIMIRFKAKYLSETMLDNDSQQSKAIPEFSIEDEFNSAYSFLLAQIDDRLSHKHLEDIKFLLKIREPVASLLDIYKNLSLNLSSFFSLLIQRGCFAGRLVMADEIIRKFQLFMKRYEDFIFTFEKTCKSSIDNGNSYTQIDAVSNPNTTYAISSLPTKSLPLKDEQIKVSRPTPVQQQPPTKPSISRPISQSSVPTPTSSNVPQKALCVIINITSFIPSNSISTPKRAGSDIDVEVIKVVFKKLNSVVLQCNYNFTKDDLDQALNHIDDQQTYGNFDCLVMFIMSHGLLNSFLTADLKDVVIRDIVKRYSDTSATTIWAGKPRLFFIQACRSPWPANVQYRDREGVKESDLSPRMLVAYSCSANQASKRSPTTGSIFIQMLCVMLLRYGHFYSIQSILDETMQFVIKRDEYSNELTGTAMSIQKPEFIGSAFSSSFRFSNTCLYNKYTQWSDGDQRTLLTSLVIWKDISDLISMKTKANHS